MSDINLQFPAWLGLAFLGLQYWYVLVPSGLALAGLAWFGRALPMALRLAAWSAAAACALPYLLLLALIAADKFGTAQRAAHDRALHRTLAAGETVAALSLPTGAVLEFADETHRALSSVELPRPALVAGILLEGRLEPITEGLWSGTLARDQATGPAGPAHCG